VDRGGFSEFGQGSRYTSELMRIAVACIHLCLRAARSGFGFHHSSQTTHHPSTYPPFGVNYESSLD
jgi:hypothetical protein